MTSIPHGPLTICLANRQTKRQTKHHSFSFLIRWRQGLKLIRRLSGSGAFPSEYLKALSHRKGRSQDCRPMMELKKKKWSQCGSATHFTQTSIWPMQFYPPVFAEYSGARCWEVICMPVPQEQHTKNPC